MTKIKGSNLYTLQLLEALVQKCDLITLRLLKRIIGTIAKVMGCANEAKVLLLNVVAVCRQTGS